MVAGQRQNPGLVPVVVFAPRQSTEVGVTGQAGEMLRAALRYADADWPVFRCQPGQKIPFEGSAGFKDATTDPAVIRSWWARWPTANVGCPDGRADRGRA